ncbi:MAG: PA14 domain-containing protein [Kiritimatiellia bacterium]
MTSAETLQPIDLVSEPTPAQTAEANAAVLERLAPNADPGIVFPVGAQVPNVRAYGAAGDGQHDDTAAFQRALLDNHKLIYIPDGEYVISDTLRWGAGEKRQVLQGQSEAGTIIRLQNRAPAFRDPSDPRPMVWTGSAPAQRFRNGIRNLTLDIGEGNPGAIGARFIANNQGGMERVTIRDRSGLGVIGLDLGYTGEQGPCLLKHITVEGFDIGISLRHPVNSVTAEYLTLRRQRTYGIHNSGQVFNIRKLTSENRGPAIYSDGASMITLVDSVLRGVDAAELLAIENQAGLFARNVDTPGYGMAVENRVGHKRNAEGDRIEEYVSHEPLSVFLSPPKSLGLPIKETPEVAWDLPRDWVSVADFGEPEPITLVRHDGKRFQTTNWATVLQKAIDSGASTIYFPYDRDGIIGLFGNVYLRNNVRRIIGMENTGYRIWPGMFPDEFTPAFVLEDGAPPEVVVERFDTWYMAFRFVQNSNRSMVVRSLSFYDLESRAGGDVFLEDVRARRLDIHAGGRLWARQLNVENWEEPKTHNAGGDFWVLGLKTEDDTTAHMVSDGGRSEILGGFIYANKRQMTPKQMFINRRSHLSFSVGEYVIRQQPFDIAIESRPSRVVDVDFNYGPERRILRHGQAYPRGGGSLIPLYTGYWLPADQAPTAPEGLTLLPKGTAAVRASWQHDGENVDGFRLELLEDGELVAQRTVAAGQRSAELRDNIRAGHQYTCRLYAFNGTGKSPTIRATVQMPSAVPAGEGTGLHGEYFDGTNFERQVCARVEGPIDFDWGTGSPEDCQVGANNFTVRWTAYVQPQYSERYRFITDTDNGVRLWVADRLLIDEWGYAREQVGEMELEAGRKYPLRMEYVARGGAARARLLWQSPNQVREPIPASQLVPRELKLPIITWVGELPVHIRAGDRIRLAVQSSFPVDSRLKIPLRFSGEMVEGMEYRLTSDRIVIQAGEKEGEAILTIQEDEHVRPEKTFSVDLAPGAGYVVGSGAWTGKLAAAKMPEPGAGEGLLGRYFEGRGFDSQPVAERVDPRIDFNWDKRRPHPEVHAELEGNLKPYSIRWTGEIEPLFSEDYIFDIDIGRYSGVRLWIDDQLVVDAWEGPHRGITRGTIRLEAGHKYALRLEYETRRFYGSRITLRWSSLSQKDQPVPTTQLHPEETSSTK